MRGESETISAWGESWNAQRFALHVAVIILGAGFYGAAMGWWRDPQQALYVAIKFPLIILLTTFGNALINAMLAPLLGLNIPFGQSFAAIVMSFTIASAILGAFSPLIAFVVWNTPAMAANNLSSSTYNFILLAHVAVIALAGVTGNVRLFQLLAQLGGSRAVALRVLTGVVGRKSVSRQPAFVDSAAIHRFTDIAGGIFPQGGLSREFLRGRSSRAPTHFPV